MIFICEKTNKKVSTITCYSRQIAPVSVLVKKYPNCITCRHGKLIAKEMINGIETKQCPEPCGAVYRRQPHETADIWRNIRYCPKHRAMSTYQRAKIFNVVKIKSTAKLKGAA